MLRVLALGDLDLAASADPAAPADRVEVDTQRRAASSTVVPRSKRPRLPDGVKTTSASLEVMRSPSSSVPRDRRGARLQRPPVASLRIGAIHSAQCASLPMSTSAAFTAWSISGWSGLVIAEVRPEAMAIGRKAAFSAGAVREPEADVRGAARRVDAELLPQTSHDAEHLSPGVPERADRHDERVDDDVLFRDAVVGGTRDDRSRHLEADVGVVRDARLVVRDRDDCRAVLRDERKHVSSRSSSPVTELTRAFPR